jgi:hypothetical protein
MDDLDCWKEKIDGDGLSASGANLSNRSPAPVYSLQAFYGVPQDQDNQSGHGQRERDGFVDTGHKEGDQSNRTN